MEDSRDLSEKPLMGTVAQEEDVLVIYTAKVTPSFGDNGPNTSPANGLHEDLGHMFWVIDNNTAKADVDGCWSHCEEVG